MGCCESRPVFSLKESDDVKNSKETRKSRTNVEGNLKKQKFSKSRSQSTKIPKELTRLSSVKKTQGSIHENYETVKRISRGSQGIINLIRDKRTKNLRVSKEITKSNLSNHDIEIFTDQIRLIAEMVCNK